MPAKSMYSYSDALYAILDEFKPKTVFEWGPGTSTQIMSLYPSVVSITSIEHEEVFYEFTKRLMLPNVLLQLRQNMDDYVGAIGEGFYDLIFIDGRDRIRCLEKARHKAPVIILHDAARSDYREAINTYTYKIWADDGNTVILTDNYDTGGRIHLALGIQVCDEPKEEAVYMVRDVKV